MGLLSETQTATFGDHIIEVQADNHVMRGLLYTLCVDGKRVAGAQNRLKLPTTKSLEAVVPIDGEERRVVVSVNQRLTSCEFALTVDGEPVPLRSVE